jgi:NADPH2:quinone reductase
MIEGINRKSHGDILTEIASLVDTGLIQPPIEEADFSLWQLARAHKRLESDQTIAKVVMSV